MTLDYQEVIDIIATVLKLALPIGTVFCISDWIVETFFKWAFPNRFKG